jgi:hypothetical protein
MEYSEFEKVILVLQASCQRVDVLSDVTDCDLFVDITGPLFDEIINLLERIFHDEEYAWISYWVFDLNYGENYMPGTVQIDGKDVPLKTIKDLYNLLKEF